MAALRFLRLHLPCHLLILCLLQPLAVFSEIYVALAFIIDGIEEVFVGNGACQAPDLLLKANGQLPVLEGAQFVQEGAVRVQFKRQVAGNREEMEEVDELLKRWAIPSMQGETLEGLCEIG